MQPKPAPVAKTIRTFPWVNLVYGAIFALAIVTLSVTLSSRLSQDDDILTLTVKDEEGQPVAEALVAYGGEVYRSSEDGKVHLNVLDAPDTITVEHAGFTTVSGEFDSAYSRDQTLTLRQTPSNVTDVAAASTPAGGTSAQHTSVADPTAPSLQDSLTATPDEVAGEIAGTLRNADGEPIDRGWVTDGTAYAFSDADGHFVFEAGTVQPGAALTVFGPGYHQMEVSASSDGQSMDLQLEIQPIRALYFNPNISNNQEDIERFIDIANTTEVNAVVIDIKEELVFYDTSVPLFNDTGVVTPILDLQNLLKQFRDNDIYTIARLVVFKDSAVAERFPELAVLDTHTGGLWRDMNGIAWVNPMDHTLWDANIDLAYEAATLGFDEIQYDYIRFPTDGDMSRVSYGLENSQLNRETAIEKFLQQSYERLIPTGVRLSADIFGYTVMVQDDLGIGQNLDQLAPHVDYLSPMIYPSHWPNGSMALDGHPNDFPYETVEISMSLAIEQLGGQRLKLRPWLQDFNMPGMRAYGEAEVRAQIDAVDDLGLSGWLMWDPNNWYHDGAFKLEAKVSPVTTPATPAVGTPVASSRATKSTRRRQATIGFM